MEEGGGRDRKRRRWRRHHKVWKAPFAIDLSPLAAILRSVPHHASPWNTILFPLGRPPSVGERVSPLCLRVFARVCAHAFYPPPNLRIYMCINTAHLFPWVESMDLLSHLPLTTPLRHDNATHANHRCNHLPDTYPDMYYVWKMFFYRLDSNTTGIFL